VFIFKVLKPSKNKSEDCCKNMLGREKKGYRMSYQSPGVLWFGREIRNPQNICR
jgi:hypothetical protein